MKVSRLNPSTGAPSSIGEGGEESWVILELSDGTTFSLREEVNGQLSVQSPSGVFQVIPEAANSFRLGVYAR